MSLRARVWWAGAVYMRRRVPAAPAARGLLVGRANGGRNGAHFLSILQLRVPRIDSLNSSVVIFDRAYPMMMKFCAGVRNLQFGFPSFATTSAGAQPYPAARVTMSKLAP